MKKRMRKLLKRMGRSTRLDWLEERAEIHRRIAAKAENGKVAVVESGMDCDGVQYWGRAAVIPASVMAYEKLDREIGEWADGPYCLGFARPSEKVEYGNRDLGMEAFENGHPWVLRP